jgi:YVTN family beta-propeller protein
MALHILELFIIYPWTLVESATLAYITNPAGSTLSVLDTASNTVLTTVTVGEGPTDVVVTSAGTRAYISGGGRIALLDTTDQTVIDSVPDLNNPQGLALDPTGTRLYVANYNTVEVTVLDTVSQTILTKVPVARNPNKVAVNPVGTRLYAVGCSPRFGLSNISVIDTASLTVIASLLFTDGCMNDVAVHPTGMWAYAAGVRGVRVLETVNNTIIAQVLADSSSEGVAVHPDGTRLYATNDGGSIQQPGTVTVIDTITLAVIAKVSVGRGPKGVAVHPDGTYLYVTNVGDGTLSILDTANMTVLTTLLVGTASMHGFPRVVVHRIPPDEPACNIQLNATTFVTGDQVLAQTVRITNPTPLPQAIEFKFWFEVPGQPPVSMARGGAEGSVVLPAGLHQSVGLLPLFTVGSELPRGLYGFHCRFIHPVTGALITQDLNPFLLQ